MTEHGTQAVIASFEKQVGWCDSLGSPFTAAVLRVLLEDIVAGSDRTAFVASWPGDPVADALPLRLAGALHALVLTGTSAPLAACYPPVMAPGLPDAVRTAMTEHGGFIRAFATSPPQTNEVGRSAVLVGGFHRIAAVTSLPLRLLEIGASAGLNLVWDRYRYRLGGVEWGDPASPLLLSPAWEGAAPTLAPLRVQERWACDVAPIDLGEEQHRLRLRAYVWPDQHQRLARIDRAMAIAIAAGHRVERADAAVWSAERLREPSPACATVFYHSIMWQYMPLTTRTTIERALVQAGERATPDAPLAWLRFEPGRPDARPELTLTLWPGGHRQTLASANAHGTTVTWSGGD